MVGAYLSFFAAGCETSNEHHRDYLAPSAVPSAGAEMLILSATYGSGTKVADVTYRVNDLLQQPGVEFFARPEWLHADPTPGWNKALVIIYEFKGRRHIFTTGEGGKVSGEILARRAKK